jgi:hypothetical protein
MEMVRYRTSVQNVVVVVCSCCDRLLLHSFIVRQRITLVYRDAMRRTLLCRSQPPPFLYKVSRTTDRASYKALGCRRARNGETDGRPADSRPSRRPCECRPACDKTRAADSRPSALYANTIRWNAGIIVSGSQRRTKTRPLDS